MPSRHIAVHGATILIGVSVLAVFLSACGVRRTTGNNAGPPPTLAGEASTTSNSPATGSATTSAAPTRTLSSGSTSHAITVNGISRTYLTYVPQNLNSSRPVPLVVFLHGGFGSAAQAEKTYRWDPKADANGFVVAYPDGENHAWNAGSCCGAPARNQVDDVSFITSVVAAVKAQIRIDPRRVYVAGMSNGAMMALTLACQIDVFAAAAPVAGAEMTSCDKPSPISIVHIHGLADTRVPMDGSPGSGKGNVPAHTSVANSVARWRSVNRCQTPTSTTKGVVTTSTSGCADGRAVTLITIAGAGHQYPGSVPKSPVVQRLLGADPPSTAIDATSVIWSFFAAHPKPA